MEDRYGWAHTILDQAVDATEDTDDPGAQERIRDAVYWTLRDRGVSHWRYNWLVLCLVWRRGRIPRWCRTLLGG